MDTTLNNRLAVLASKIKAAHAEVEANAGKNFDRMMEIGAYFKEARTDWTADREFNRWLFENDMIDYPSSNDRAGYILMSQQPDLAREAFDGGKWSPQSIGRYISKAVKLHLEELAKELKSDFSASTVLYPYKTEPVETNISETPLSDSISPVIAIVPDEIIAAAPDPEPQPQDLTMTPISIPVTQPSNSTLTLKTKHVQPQVPLKPGSRRHPIEAHFKDPDVVETIFKLWGGRGKHSSVTISRLARKPANRPMILKMIEVVQTNNWTPSASIHTLSPSLLNANLKGKGRPYKETPTGIQACIEEALQLDRQVQGIVDPEAEARNRAAYEAMLARLKISSSPASVPSDAGTRFNYPAADENITVYGTVIREKGIHPEIYQDWWQGAEFIFHLLQVFGHLKPEQLGNIAQTLNTGRHWLRGIDVYQLEQVMGKIAQAMIAAKDNSGLVSATARVRLADK